MHQFIIVYEVDNKCKNMFDSYKCDENSYLFLIKMEKYYTTLGKFVYNNSLTENKIYFDKIVKQILIGLYNLHINNFIHGDLKSANIMINRDLKIFLIDFGGVKTIDTVFYTKSCTLTYRSIEELEYELNYRNTEKNKNLYYKPSFSNDIWSLGIIFSEILLKNNFMQRYYTKIERLFRKNNNKNEDYEEYAEKCIYEKYSKKTINILHYAHKLLIYNIDTKYIEVINKMLSINSNLKKLLEIRNEEYNWILKFLINDDILIIIPLMINIADRFFTFVLENNYQEKLPKIEHINKILLIACLLLSMVFKYVDIPKLKIFYSFFNINISFANFKTYIHYAVALIINKLNFDIYRPYHDDKLTKEIMNNDDNCLKYLHDLHKKISLLIHSEKINLTPTDFYE